MKNLKDAKTKTFPSKTRGGKELPSSSALDSPSVIRKLTTPLAINSNMSQVIDDATSTMNDAYDDARTMLDLAPVFILLKARPFICKQNKCIQFRQHHYQETKVPGNLIGVREL